MDGSYRNGYAVGRQFSLKDSGGVFWYVNNNNNRNRSPSADQLKPTISATRKVLGDVTPKYNREIQATSNARALSKPPTSSIPLRKERSTTPKTVSKYPRTNTDKSSMESVGCSPRKEVVPVPSAELHPQANTSKDNQSKTSNLGSPCSSDAQTQFRSISPCGIQVHHGKLGDVPPLSCKSEPCSTISQGPQLVYGSAFGRYIAKGSLSSPSASSRMGTDIGSPYSSPAKQTAYHDTLAGNKKKLGTSAYAVPRTVQHGADGKQSLPETSDLYKNLARTYKDVLPTKEYHFANYVSLYSSPVQASEVKQSESLNTPSKIPAMDCLGTPPSPKRAIVMSIAPMNPIQAPHDTANLQFSSSHRLPDLPHQLDYTFPMNFQPSPGPNPVPSSPDRGLEHSYDGVISISPPRIRPVEVPRTLGQTEPFHDLSNRRASAPVAQNQDAQTQKFSLIAKSNLPPTMNPPLPLLLNPLDTRMSEPTQMSSANHYIYPSQATNPWQSTMPSLSTIQALRSQLLYGIQASQSNTISPRGPDIPHPYSL